MSLLWDGYDYNWTAYGEAAGGGITSVDTGGTADTIIPDEQTVITLDVGIGSTAGIVEVVSADGQYVATQTINVWNNTDDEITISGLRGELPFGVTDAILRVTLDDGSQVATSGITMQAPTGTFWVNGSSADTDEGSILHQALSAPTGDYQIIWTDPDGTGIDDSDPIEPDGYVPDAGAEGDLLVKVWDATDGSTSPEATYTIEFQVPQGTTVIESTTVDQDEVEVQVSYDLDDYTGFEARFDGGTPQSFAYPTDFYTLSDGTHTVEVRAVNDGGGGTWSDSESFTISATGETSVSLIAGLAGPEATLSSTMGGGPEVEIAASLGGLSGTLIGEVDLTGIAEFEVGLSADLAGPLGSGRLIHVRGLWLPERGYYGTGDYKDWLEE